MAFGSFAKVAVATVVVAIDGTGDATDIQEGIDLLPATGGSVYIKEGTYTITVAVSVITPNVSIIGAGKSTRINIMGNINGIFVDTVDDVTIEKLYVYGNDDQTAASRLIRLSNANNSSVRDCWLENSTTSGIGTSDCNNFSALNNVGFEVLNTIYLVRTSYSVIASNRSTDCGADGILLSAGIKCVVSGNISHGCGDDGISVIGASSATVTGNVCEDNTDDGINLIDADNCSIVGNYCNDNGDDGIKLNNVGCVDNIIVGNGCKGNAGSPIVDNGVGTEIGHNQE